MTDLISRQAVLDQIVASVNQFGGRYTAEQLNMWGLFTQLIKEAASAQPEVIRCRDCRFYQDNNGGYPHEDCKWNKDETPDEDDYCSCGEKRTDEVD